MMSDFPKRKIKNLIFQKSIQTIKKHINFQYSKKNRYYVLKTLLNNNIDLDISDYTGRTIYDIAASSRDKRILKLLN